MADIAPPPDCFPITVETLIIGAGACGLGAALAAHEAGQEVLIIERDAVPAGSTALSAGLIPAAGTVQQHANGIEDTAELFADDIQRKANDENDPGLVDLMARTAAPVIDWLTGAHDMPFTLVDDFDYPGHSRRRMHGLPSRSGQELVDALRARVEVQDIDIICKSIATTLFVDTGRIAGIAIRRTDGAQDVVGCRRLILACDGFGGNAGKVATNMPQIADALWFGHGGNQGEALDWAEALGAQTRHLGAHQGHGNVADPHGILITWAVITEGGVQVNAKGQRFWNEAQGYSEAARAVLAQPGGRAITLFDGRIAEIARQFADFQAAEAQGAVQSARTLEEIETRFDLPAWSLSQTLEQIPETGRDAFGREFAGKSLAPPFCAVRVTGALFHTQGGLIVDDQARAIKQEGTAFATLFAAGGAACGVSGQGDAGYLSGNGLLSAATLVFFAGRSS